MAITWECSITNVKVAEKRADVSFSRVDDVLETTEAYSFRGVILETTAQKTALLNLVWAKHQELITKQSAIDAFVSDLEDQAKTNLEAREV